MFDSVFVAASDVELVAAIEDGVRQEAIAGARRLAAIAELTRRRVDADDERVWWAFDPWDSVCAEVAAAMAIGSRRASGQMRIAQALREHLPLVAALYSKGALSTRLVSTITWGTRLVDDDEAWAHIDAAVAERATRWERLSEDKLRDAVQMQVARFDPDAQRRTETAVRGRDFTIGACDDDDDTVAVWGRLLAHDGAVLQQRVTAMVDGVCANDPRSAGERRSDAIGAIANGNDVLACRCGSPACPTTGVTPKSNVVIRVIADPAAITDATTPPDTTAEQGVADKPDTTTAVDRRLPAPALLLGHGVLPNALLAEAIRNGATIKPIRMPDAAPEPRYRPSDELAEFVRMRDLFCRFPGCTVPADRCDIDHVIPWPWGPTHASNLNCKCRKHHLMKTFWTGIGGWADQQLPDATVIWTAPSGKTYTTQPGSRLFFPTW
ncbi:HNH endonuclease signature motif containing protein, partial [Mycolicibacterium stellerae]|uniref:HNH endonuclease signature motif containing protein n=1 Tax=Mycolicibacterium stellerae TaxID=2358193 RepID=UPI0013DE0F6C